MTKTADEIMAGLPPFLKESFERIAAEHGAKEQAALNTNSCALASYDDAEPELVQVPAPVPAAYTGRIQPSIYCDRGDRLSVFLVGGAVDVVLRDGGGQQHHGRLAPPLLAEGGLPVTDEPQDRAFRDRVFEVLVLPERQEDALHAAKHEGRSPDRSGDRNHTHRATALWRNRDRTGAAHSRAMLIVSWSGTTPVHALLMDGDKLLEFALQREKPGGNRPHYSGVAR